MLPGRRQGGAFKLRGYCLGITRGTTGQIMHCHTLSGALGGALKCSPAPDKLEYSDNPWFDT